MTGYRADAADRHQCPDCNNDVRLTQVEGNVWILTVLHDETCPWLVTRRQEPCS